MPIQVKIGLVETDHESQLGERQVAVICGQSMCLIQCRIVFLSLQRMNYEANH